MENPPVPQVTEEDLRHFHSKHFPLASAPDQLFYSYNESHEHRDDGDDDDGLGWYPDGVKRHLTDDQIKIFRHSEIQKLLREHRLNPELTDPSYTPSTKIRAARSDDHAAPQKSKSRKNKNKAQKRKLKQINDLQQSSNSDPANVARWLPSETTSGKAKHGASHRQPPSSRRKWDEFIEDDEGNPDKLTHRRLAREQDNIDFQPMELSYDD